MGKCKSLIPDSKLAGFVVVKEWSLATVALRKLFDAIVEEVGSGSVVLDWASHVGNVEEYSDEGAGGSTCNAISEKYMSSVRGGLLTADCKFQVTENVHGCNASLVVDAAGKVTMGKCRSLIPDNKLAGFHRGE